MLSVEEVLHALNCVPQERRGIIDEFVSDSAAGRRYLLGRNEHSTAIMQSIDIEGVIDDFAEKGVTWNGKTVLKTQQVPDNAMIVNCSMCTGPVSAARRLEDLESAVTLSLADLCSYLPERFRMPAFIRLTRKEVTNNLPAWINMSESLADDESRSTLDDLLYFRLTGDYRSMRSYSVRPQEQYFETFVGLLEGDVFVDAGGYDGDTTEQFCKRYPRYKHVYLFEPSARNLAKAHSRLQRFRDITFIGEGLSDQKGILSFNAEAGSACAVDKDGSCQIQVTTLDERVDEKITFIKMDLEGWELHALRGARQHLLEDRPSLAIAVYHEAADFRKTFEYVTALCSDYRVYLRHYTEGWSESVMYFVPADKKRV
ncbi:MAG: FkbM family methyltransferase [Candidatus Thiodiazotropha sp. (ex Lucinoma kastoroae)]|nr:FkbM family methyltransferase [Candidatus Thiodiazotropha sp. (ex Lucinoma kastoroae)]